MDTGGLRELIRRTVCSLFAVASIGACSSVDQSQVAPSRSTVTSVAAPAVAATDVVVPKDYVLPLTRFEFTMTEQTQVSEALNLLLGRCMQRYGYRQDVDVMRQQSAASRAWQVRDFGPSGNARRYGIADPNVAVRVGYHLPSQVLGDASSNNSESILGLGSPSSQMDALLTGHETARNATSTPRVVATGPNGVAVPAGGCIAVATEELSVGSRVLPGEAPPLVSSLRAESFSQAGSDIRVAQAQSAWSACMKARGYSGARSVLDVVSDLGIPMQEDSVSSREREAATADASCNLASGYAVAYFSAETQLQQIQLRKHFSELSAIEADKDRIMRKVKRILE